MEDLEIVDHNLSTRFMVNFPNVISRLNTEPKLVSKTFIFGSLPWNISLEINSFCGCKIVPCFLNCLEMKPGFSCKVNFKVSTLRASGPPFEKAELTSTFNDTLRTDGFTLLTLATLCNPSERYIFEDALTLHVELITGIIPLQKTKEEVAQTLLSSTVKGVVEDFSDLIDSGDGDVTFILKRDGVILKAHKNILCVRNSVFARMLIGNMKEAKKMEVIIEDMGKTALRIVFLHIYTGQLSFFGGLDVDVCKEVVNAAEKYNLQELKEFAGMALAELATRTPEDIFEHYKFLKLLNAKEATEALASYIKMNTDEILKKC